MSNKVEFEYDEKTYSMPELVDLKFKAYKALTGFIRGSVSGIKAASEDEKLKITENLEETIESLIDYSEEYKEYTSDFSVKQHTEFLAKYVIAAAEKEAKKAGSQEAGADFLAK